MINLDDTNQIIALQGGDSVLVSTAEFGKQIEQSFSEIQRVSFPKDYSTVQHVVMCGMGGSRFPALILYHLFKKHLKTSFTIVDDYEMPGYVSENTLVILGSYSGNTEEVLECAKQAKKAKAKIMGYCIGSSLALWLQENGCPSYTFNPIHNPSHQPRIGSGYALGSLLGVFHVLNLLEGVSIDQILFPALSELETVQETLSPKTPLDQNPAKSLARKLMNRYPYYIVAEHLVGVGNAIQNQTNETAKNMASYHVIPELNHHLMEGLQFPKEHSSLAIFVLFQSSLYSDRIQKRFTITRDVIRQNNIEIYEHQLAGNTKLSQALELFAFGTAMTTYLSALYGVDPMKIPFVDYFKDQLSKS